jgi:23S rRNA pseudouridine2605 synthase
MSAVGANAVDRGHPPGQDGRDSSVRPDPSRNSDNRSSKTVGRGRNQPARDQKSQAGRPPSNQTDERQFTAQKNQRANVSGNKQDRSPGAGQPDPLKTSLGYIGADSLMQQRQQRRSGTGSGGSGGAQRRPTRGR